MRGETVFEITAFYQLHHKVVAAALGEKIIHLDDVRVTQRSSRFGFATEALDGARLGVGERAEHLERHRPAQAVIPRAKDGCHAACCQMGLKLVA